MGDTLEYFDPLVLKHFNESIGLILSTSVRHPLANSCFVLILHHFKELLMSRTHKLHTQIKQVCQEIRDMNIIRPMRSHNPLSTDRKNMEPLPNKCEKDEEGYTCSTGNKKHAHCEGLCNSPHNQICHASPVLPSPLPPSSPSPTSSHSSSEVSSSAPSTVRGVKPAYFFNPLEE